MDFKQLVLLGVGIAASAVSAIGLYCYLTLPKYIKNSDGNTYEPTTENIQVAIDDLGEKGGTVWLPPKTFYISHHLILNDKVKLYGFFDLTKLVLFNDIYIWTRNGGENIGLYDLHITGAGVILFSNCVNSEIKNVKAKNISYRTGAIELINCRNSIISNCKTEYTAYYGIYLGQSEYCTVDGCDTSHSFYTSGTGIQLLESSHNLVSNNHVHYIGTLPTGGFDTKVSPGGPGIRCSPYGSACHNNVITHNNIHHIREHGIKTYPTCTNNEISYNKISMINMGNPGDQSMPYGWALDMGGSSIIRGNEIGINRECYGGAVIHDDSIDAIIEDNYIYYIDETRENAIQPRLPCTIRNNHLKGKGTQGSSGINHWSAHNCIIENNIIDNFFRAIHVTTSNYSIIRYNLLKNSSRGIRFDGGTGLTVTNNTIQCCDIPLENEESLIDSTIEYNEIIPC